MVALLSGWRLYFRRPVALLLRVVGYRPGPGLVHRPIEEPTPPRRGLDSSNPSPDDRPAAS
jgi:hypothetical protein